MENTSQLKQGDKEIYSNTQDKYTALDRNFANYFRIMKKMNKVWMS